MAKKRGYKFTDKRNAGAGQNDDVFVLFVHEIQSLTDLTLMQTISALVPRRSCGPQLPLPWVPFLQVWKVRRLALNGSINYRICSGLYAGIGIEPTGYFKTDKLKENLEGQV